MTANSTYKTYISAFLLVLYVFVATPVQLWHHHNYSKTTSSGASDKKETASFTKYVGKSFEGNCQICSHQYSTYIDGTAVIFAAPPFFATAKKGFYFSSIPSSPLFNISNKGPPALA